jgi:transposase
VSEHLGVSRSTLYRWLHKIQDDDKQMRIPVNKTPEDIVVLIWEITKSNINWGRVRIANQLALLNIFISASTVRNVLNKPQPRNPEGSSANSTKTSEKTEPKHIPAWYPNHSGQLILLTSGVGDYGLSRSLLRLTISLVKS